MLKYYITFIFCAAAFFCSAQNLKLNNLEACINKTATRVSDSLVNKGWKLDASLTGSEQNDNYKTFSFGNLKTDPKKALAWLRVHDERTNVNRVYYQAPSQEAYEEMLKEIEALKLTKSDSDIMEGQILTIYTGPLFTYQTITYGTSYTIVVISTRYFNEHLQPR